MVPDGFSSGKIGFLLPRCRNDIFSVERKEFPCAMWLFGLLPFVPSE
jgi:hypothetical protein